VVALIPEQYAALLEHTFEYVQGHQTIFNGPGRQLNPGSKESSLPVGTALCFHSLVKTRR
jgi:hypothetical protein